jgi:phosphoglycolate phosphatase
MNPEIQGCERPPGDVPRNLLQAVRGVVFDFDGTLVATQIDFAGMRRAITDLIQRWGLGDLVLVPSDYPLEMVAAGCRILENDAERAATLKREAMDIIEGFEMQTCPYAAPFPGVMDTLEQLAARGYRLGIITRNGHKGVRSITSRYPIHHEVLLTREDVTQVKPHPEHLFTAIRALGLTPPLVLMVGDHPTDVMCGRAAGTLSVGVSKDPQRIAELSQAGADFLIGAVPELMNLLNGEKSRF